MSHRIPLISPLIYIQKSNFYRLLRYGPENFWQIDTPLCARRLVWNFLFAETRRYGANQRHYLQYFKPAGKPFVFTPPKSECFSRRGDSNERRCFLTTARNTMKSSLVYKSSFHAFPAFKKRLQKLRGTFLWLLSPKNDKVHDHLPIMFISDVHFCKEQKKTNLNIPPCSHSFEYCCSYRNNQEDWLNAVT